MLVLSRLPEEEIVIGENVVVKILRIDGEHVRIGISAPRDVSIHRREVFDAIARVYAEEGGEGGGNR